MNRFIVYNDPQRSPEWVLRRVGHFTGTLAPAALASKSTATYQNALIRVVTERLTREPQEDGFTNDAMEWGIAHEDEARIAYEMHTGHDVKESGFLSLGDVLAGCSLDGHVGDYEGIVEIKCPFKTARHIATLRGGVPAEYKPQVMHNLWISNADWCDYISYDPRLPEKLRLSVHRLRASDLPMADYIDKAQAFLKAVEAELAALRTLADLPAVLTEAVL